MTFTHLKIETLTPLHVGSGRTLQGNTEYLHFADHRQVAVVDERKVLDIIGEENLNQWLSIIERGDDLLGYLRRRRPNLQPAETSRRLLGVVGNRAPGGVQTIREQLFSGNGQPMLPGSSLKGAVRTAVFNALIQEKPEAARRVQTPEESRRNFHENKFSIQRKGDFKEITETWSRNSPHQEFRLQDRKLKYKGGKVEGAYLGPDPNHDVFRLLRIGDAHFDETVCLLAETLNERGNGFEMKESVKQFIECIPAGAETLCRVGIPADLKNQIARHDDVARKMKNRDRLEWPRLLADVNAQTRRLIQGELDRYQSANLPNGAAAYLDELKRFLPKLPENECVIRVGFGTGYLNMTGGWPIHQWHNLPGVEYQQEMADLGGAVRHRKGYEGFALPKSRKMVLGGVPLGYLKLTLLTAEQAKAWESVANERAERQIRQAAAALAQAEQEAARQRAEQAAAAAEAQRKAEEARKPQMHPGPATKNLEVDAEVVVSGKPNRVKIYVAAYEDRLFDMVESAQQPKGYLCRVALVMEKGKILRVRHLKPK